MPASAKISAAVLVVANVHLPYSERAQLIVHRRIIFRRFLHASRPPFSIQPARFHLDESPPVARAMLRACHGISSNATHDRIVRRLLQR